MMDFLTFRRMITPIVIQIVFWLAVIGVVLAGCAVIAGSLMAPRQDSPFTFGISLLAVLRRNSEVIRDTELA